MKNIFIHLRVHTNFSLAEGMLSFDYLSKFCIQNNQPAIAITDTSNMFGVLEFSINMVSKGIQPIIGMQVNISGTENLENCVGEVVLIAKNEIGYKNLLVLTSELSVNSNFDKFISYENLKHYKDGIILLTGGIENGFVGKPASLGNLKLVNDRLKILKDLFDDNLYIELQRHGIKSQVNAEKILLDSSHKFNLPLVATNDCFFENENKFNAHQVLTCIDKGLTISSNNRRLLTKEHYIKDSNKMISLFKDIPEAVENTVVIAQRCSFFAKTHEPILPKFPGLQNVSETEYLSNVSKDGLMKRFQVSNKKFTEKEKDIYENRLLNELNIINKMGFAGYFLIVYDFIRWSKDNNIPVGPGRGSGAGSIVAWSLNITDLDPIKWGLLFERFLNPERISMPDFDIDFCQDRREEVIQYVRGRYGKDRVAQIITFGSLQAKAAIRDVGRVLEMPYGQVDKIAKLIPFIPSNPVTIQEAIDTEEALQKEISEDDQVEKLIETAIDIEGLNRHASTHAAGLVIGDRPLNQLVPLYKFSEEEIPATQFNMKFVEKAGLVKFDFLGLKTLTVLAKAETLIRKKYKKFVLNEISLDDPKTYEMLSTGATTGIFQLESAGMKDVLIGLKPDRFEDIIAVVSLYRPGPMENIPSYINRKHGREEIIYMHSSLETILKETYGIFIYQEQVLRAAQILANFSLGSADILRRAMGKKDKNEMFQQKKAFLTGAQNKNISEDKANEIFDQISAFAGYGFNKSHAAAYALIAYQTAWIKANFPHEFFASMMTVENNNTEKLSIFVQDLKKNGITILQPCINYSSDEFKIEEVSKDKSAIRYSLSSLKNVGKECIKKIVEIRLKEGLFKSIDDLLNKVPQGLITKKTFESLIKSGALDSIENNRNKLFESIELMINHIQSIEKDKISNQQNLFNDTNENKLLIDLPKAQDWSAHERLNNEFLSLGLYLSSHPLNSYLKILNKIDVKKILEISEEPNKYFGKNIQLCGLIFKIQKRLSSRGRWASFQLNDIGGEAEIVIYSDTINKYESLLNERNLILVDVEIKNETNQGFRIIGRRIRSLNQFISDNECDMVIQSKTNDFLKKIVPLLNNLEIGGSNISLIRTTENKKVEIKIKEKIKLSSQLISDLSLVNGIDCINFI
ncbi:MAG: DNA polymerase III subunit alpha [Candidatus Puniceispirillales bacterium]